MKNFCSQFPRLIMQLDPWLLSLFIILTTVGLVMMTSASIGIADRVHHNEFHFMKRQLIALSGGLCLGAILISCSSQLVFENSRYILLICLLLLALVLIPGIGKSINGSYRWIPVGVFNLQVSELMKLGFIIYLAGYLSRKKREILYDWKIFLIPLSLLAFVAVLLLLEPDLGAVVVIGAVSMGLFLVAGVPWLRLVGLGFILSAAATLLILLEPYRLARLKSFINPWLDPLDSGFQLTQSLMAFGRGGWFGAGLGNSLQKQFYLPEAHTDFVFAIIAEELGVIGAMLLIAIMMLLVFRTMYLAYKMLKKNKLFEAYMMIGIASWIGLQTLINVGVNIGALPTKGLTLPFISYGGSSMLVMCIAIALVLRLDYEIRVKKPYSLIQWAVK